MTCWVTTDTPATPNGTALAMTQHGTEEEAWRRVFYRFRDWELAGRNPITTPSGAHYASPTNGLTASVTVSRCTTHRGNS